MTGGWFVLRIHKIAPIAGGKAEVGTAGTATAFRISRVPHKPVTVDTPAQPPAMQASKM